jgi:hypothetical protein
MVHWTKVMHPTCLTCFTWLKMLVIMLSSVRCLGYWSSDNHMVYLMTGPKPLPKWVFQRVSKCFLFPLPVSAILFLTLYTSQNLAWECITMCSVSFSVIITFFKEILYQYVTRYFFFSGHWEWGSMAYVHMLQLIICTTTYTICSIICY